MTVILFGYEFNFTHPVIAESAIEVAKDCESVEEFTSILCAEEVPFVHKYVSNNATHSDYQLSLLQG